ncbi:MAG TPA: patatin-like phospholipase family protein [Flavobacterium sp.]|jgi:predicted acylesterase/phospholipase RssA
MESGPKPFRIGLCMAGAVSAGAYTAGVMDYLLEALAEWEKRRGQPNVPSHRVVIPVMGGASAGGMTALLTASTINNPIAPVELPASGDLLKEHPENKLYNSWVDLLEVDMFPRMLDTSDIKSGNVISLLNSDFIDAVAKKMICCDGERWCPTPPYFEAPVKVFTTLSNLEGFKYNVDFNSARQKAKYNMSVHNDYACFEVFDGVTAAAPTKGWIPLNFKTEENLATARDAAMATGAFPLGLKSRTVEREEKYVFETPWLKEYFDGRTPTEGKKIKTLNVDGGMINNEPFEKVRKLLDDISLASESFDKDNIVAGNSNYNTFENTVLLVDPFPSTDPEEFDFKNDITSIIGKTLSAMTAQMRAKPVEYRAAMEMVDASQYIISPSREIHDKEGNIVGDPFGVTAIACGTLGGFGGFLSKEFRIHDYYLGRYNCEIFLRDYFTVPVEALTKNPIFRDGYSTVTQLDHYCSKGTRELRYQIIPIFTPHPPQGTFPMPKFSGGTTWPVLSEKTIDNFEKPVRRRVEKVILNVASLNKGTGLLLLAGARIVLNKLFARKVLSAIKDSLYKWGLISGYKPEKR